MSDTDCLNWLEQNPTRLQDVYWRVQNENETVRQAIEWLSKD